MKVKESIVALCLGISILSATVIPCIPADAGMLPVEIDQKSEGYIVNANDWFMTDDLSVDVENNKISFTDKSTADARIASNTKLVKFDGASNGNFIDAEMTLTISSLDDYCRFGLAFGLDYAFEYVETAGSAFVWFNKHGDGIGMGISTYDKQGLETCVYESVSKIADFSDSFILSVSAKLDNTWNILINGTPVHTGEVPVLLLEGYFGFGQTGRSLVDIENVSVFSYTNETPSNIDYSERFLYDEFNATALYTSSKGTKETDKGIYVRNGKLAFQNVGTGHVAVKHIYSNMQFSFDLKLDKNTVITEDGRVQYNVTSGFSVLLGEETYKKQSNNAYEIRFEPTEQTFLHPEVKTLVKLYEKGNCLFAVELSEELNIFGANYNADERFNLCVSMVDGILDVSIRVGAQIGYKQVFRYDFGFTPLGYVQILSHGVDNGAWNELCNLSIDNIVITNFDKNGKVKDFDFRTNIWDVSDFVYEDTWSNEDLLD